MVLNSLSQGRCGSTTTNRRDQADLVGGPLSRIQLQLWDRLCCESQRLERRRGEAPPPIGVQALAKLLKMGPDETYLIGSKRRKHVPLIADLIAEPENAGTVDLLRALPEEEAVYYANEKNLLRAGEVSEVIMAELTQRYGFVGGEQREYERYFLRDHPPQMWDFCLEDEVQELLC